MIIYEKRLLLLLSLILISGCFKSLNNKNSLKKIQASYSNVKKPSAKINTLSGGFLTLAKKN